MTVYIIQAGEGGPVKIGFTRDVFKRLAYIQTGCPAKIKLLHLFEGVLADERVLHQRFAANRLHGEWFSPLPEIVSGDLGLKPIAFVLPAPVEKPKVKRQTIEEKAQRDAISRAAVDLVLAKVSSPELGRQLGLSRWAVGAWAQIPGTHVRRVSEVTGIPRHVLRPDIFEAPGAGA